MFSLVTLRLGWIVGPDSWFIVPFLRIPVVYFLLLYVSLIVCSPQCEVDFLLPEHIHVHLLLMCCSSSFTALLSVVVIFAPLIFLFNGVY